MPRNHRKKIRKFLAARQNRLRPRGKMSDLPALWFDIFCAVLIPVLFALIYAVLWLTDAFSPIYPALHYLALVVIFSWMLLAYRGAKGYWSTRAHTTLAGVACLLVSFGSCWPIGSASSLKIWVSPPAYVHQPSFELDGIKRGKTLELIEGSIVHVEAKAESGHLSVSFAGQTNILEANNDVDVSTTLLAPKTGRKEQQAVVVRKGWRRLAMWKVRLIPDSLPQISFTEEPEVTPRKTIRFAYKAMDDFGVAKIFVRIAPTVSTSGVSTEPVEILLATPTVPEIEAASYADLTALPWIGVPVTAQLVAIDGAEHKAWSSPKVLALPSRTFRNPFARALIEERQKLLQQPDAATIDEVANVMAGIARQQIMYRGDPLVMMSLRTGAVRLVLNDGPDTLPSVARVLWQTAVRLDEGPVGEAREALAEAEADFAAVALRGTSPELLAPHLLRLHKAIDKYFEKVDLERSHQPKAFREMDWPLLTARERLTAEDLYKPLTIVQDQIAAGDRAALGKTLSKIQSVIEALRTTPPELTPEQTKIVQQISSLRVLIHGQKNLGEDVVKIVSQGKAKTSREREAYHNALARALAQQQMLLASLRDIMNRQGLALDSAIEGEKAMGLALASLQKNQLTEVKEKQDQAIEQLQKSLAVMTEHMRRAMTAEAPHD